MPYHARKHLMVTTLCSALQAPHAWLDPQGHCHAAWALPEPSALNRCPLSPCLHQPPCAPFPNSHGSLPGPSPCSPHAHPHTCGCLHSRYISCSAAACLSAASRGLLLVGSCCSTTTAPRWEGPRGAAMADASSGATRLQDTSGNAWADTNIQGGNSSTHIRRRPQIAGCRGQRVDLGRGM